MVDMVSGEVALCEFYKFKKKQPQPQNTKPLLFTLQKYFIGSQERGIKRPLLPASSLFDFVLSTHALSTHASATADTKLRRLLTQEQRS